MRFSLKSLIRFAEILFMKFFTNKIRAAFGNISEIKSTDVEDFTEDIINSIDKTPFAKSDQNVLYVDNKELGGYYYLLTIIVGSFKVKTKKGAKLILNGALLLITNDIFLYYLHMLINYVILLF